MIKNVGGFAVAIIMAIAIIGFALSGEDAPLDKFNNLNLADLVIPLVISIIATAAVIPLAIFLAQKTWVPIRKYFDFIWLPEIHKGEIHTAILPEDGFIKNVPPSYNMRVKFPLVFRIFPAAFIAGVGISLGAYLLALSLGKLPAILIQLVSVIPVGIWLAANWWFLEWGRLRTKMPIFKKTVYYGRARQPILNAIFPWFGRGLWLVGPVLGIGGYFGATWLSFSRGQAILIAICLNLLVNIGFFLLWLIEEHFGQKHRIHMRPFFGKGVLPKMSTTPMGNFPEVNIAADIEDIDRRLKTGQLHDWYAGRQAGDPRQNMRILALRSIFNNSDDIILEINDGPEIKKLLENLSIEAASQKQMNQVIAQRAIGQMFPPELESGWTIEKGQQAYVNYMNKAKPLAQTTTYLFDLWRVGDPDYKPILIGNQAISHEDETDGTNVASRFSSASSSNNPPFDQAWEQISSKGKDELTAAGFTEKELRAIHNSSISSVENILKQIHDGSTKSQIMDNLRRQ